MFHCRVKNEMRMQSGEWAHRDVRQRSIRRIWSSSLKALEVVAAFTRTQKSHNCLRAGEKAGREAEREEGESAEGREQMFAWERNMCYTSDLA